MNRRPLSVLIVEDNPNKKQKLFQHLQSRENLFDEPVISVCASDAIRQMENKCYDLLILDISIPMQAAGDPSEENSINLLLRLDGGVRGINKPKYILPISSLNSLSPKAREFFNCRPWGIIPYDEQSTQSLAHIESIATWIFNDSSNSSTLKNCDAFVLTALEDPEFSAIEATFPNLGPLEPLDSKQLIRFCEIEVEDRKIVVGTAFCQRMGPVAAAILTTKVVSRLQPKLLIMAGICASTSEKFGIGDLIAAEETWDWQSGKLVDSDGDEEFQGAPHQLGFDTVLKSPLLLLKKDSDFWAGLANDASQMKLPIPKMGIGPVASGASVVANRGVIERIKKLQNKNVIGLDMETYAMHASVEAAPENVLCASLKAVCDNGDKEKNDNYQKFAAMVSARAVFKFIEKFYNS